MLFRIVLELRPDNPEDAKRIKYLEKKYRAKGKKADAMREIIDDSMKGEK